MNIFTNEVEYQTEDLISNFRNGCIYHYVGSSFLNGYINYTNIIKAYLLERYISQGEKFYKEVWNPFINNPPFHMDLYELGDDVLILSKTNYHYYFFWFDCDVSDCAIGRQLKKDLDDKIMINWFDNYVEDLLEPKAIDFRNKHRENINEDEDIEGISGYIEIPIDCFRGWISF